jgi:hypothetical protein
MFDESSRYANLETQTVEIRTGEGTVRTARYVKRRIIPPTEDEMVIAEHVVTQGDRLDMISASYLGDPLQFWRICDTNNVAVPSELEEVGTTIKISLPLT